MLWAVVVALPMTNENCSYFYFDSDSPFLSNFKKFNFQTSAQETFFVLSQPPEDIFKLIKFDKLGVWKTLWKN